ncbi:nucleotidyltransferase domain-containing protein [Candidatus Woesearchaeota archaeon]|nr:nucleotidyltransferase domain-containing protein [Candidatus Woesearchaeota archaeon]
MTEPADKLLSYVYDFLSMVFEDLSIKGRIRNVILFGSVAKGTYDKESDIDLFFDVKDRLGIKNVEKNLRSILNSFEVKAERTWNLKGIRLPVNFIVGSLEDETWKNLKDEIISSGVVLYGSYKEIPDNLKYCYVFYYSLRNLNRKDKMKFIRRIFGYSLKRGKKEYKQMGLLDEIRGFKLSSNAILISGDDILKVKNLFNEFRIKYRVKETWVRE